MSFFNELKRRNVVKVGVAYGIAAWLLLQIIDVVLPNFGAPQWVVSTLMFIVLLGFPVTLVLAWTFQFTPEGIKTQQHADDANYQSSGAKLNGLIMGVLSLAVVFMALDNYVLEESPAGSQPVSITNIALNPDLSGFVTDTTETPTSPISLDVEVPEKSIAVLPFSNLSSDPEQAYFSDGLTEELLNKLAQVGDLLVAGRTSSFFYKDKNEDLRVIGETLGVAHILEGSVRKAGNAVRITAQLIRADDGFHLWSETYDRELEDIFAIQDEIATAVTQALSITMQAGEFSQPGMTRNIEAYEEFLQARQDFYTFLPETIPRAIDHIERAVNIDPAFAQAWSLMSAIYENSPLLLQPTETVNFAQRRQEALERMRALYPDMPDLRLIDAGQLWERNDRISAEDALQTIIAESNNGNANAALLYANLLVNVGRRQEALAYHLQARRLEPMDPLNSWWLIQSYLNLGRVDEAYAEIERGLSIDGLDQIISGLRMITAFQTGNREGAMSALDRMSSTEQFNFTLARLWLDGDTEGALSELRRIISNPDQPPLVFVLGTQWAAALGDPQLALDIRVRSGDASTIWMPYNAEMRKLPGFKSWLEALGIADYWRTTGNWADLCRPLEGNDDFECF